MKNAAETGGQKGVQEYDLVVIGGGPAGMMAAGRAAERGLKVILLEKNWSLGKKLLITGGGRCNVTNAELNTRVFLDKFKDSGKFLFSAFSQFSVRKTLDFFHIRGMPTKEEAGKRVFPVSDKAKSVWDVMNGYLKSGGVVVRSNAAVTGFVQSKPGLIDGVKLKGGAGGSGGSGEIIRGKSFVLATGGKSHPETGSTGEGFGWLAKLGHKIVEPTASLVPIAVSDAWVKAISGVSLDEAKITLFLDGVKQGGKKGGGSGVRKGKVLFTHFGLSGPAILNMSAEVGEAMKYGEVVLSLDLLPKHDYATLNEALQKLFAQDHRKKFKNAIGGLVPNAFVPAIIEQSGLDGETPCNSITREARLALVKVLKGLPIHPTGLLGTDKAIITSGGAALEEVDFRTMQSRLVPNLYLVGDVLDVDRPSGGYSLQLCWTTGWVAGNALQK